jgi:hypothetical protein
MLETTRFGRELVPTLLADVPTITDWIAADPDHRDKPFTPEYFQTGYNFLNFKIVDDEGPVLFVRTEQDPHQDESALLSLQFAPYDIVSKRRLIRAITQVFPIFIAELQKTFQAVRFESTNDRLIRFFKHLGFEASVDNMYVLRFESAVVA